MKDSHRRGQLAELAVTFDLIARGWNVYRAVDGHQHPDLVAFDPQGKAVRLEVRAVRTTGKKASGKCSDWRPRKATDDCDAYAFVGRDLKTITYEPAKRASKN